VSVGRNDPCPCGSGAKYKRCCLDRELELERLVAELEGTVRALGQETWELDREWYLARFDEIYDGGIEAFGALGPTDDERLDAELWFLLDCPLPDGQTPLWRMRLQGTGRAGELLARSELRAWQIESPPRAGVLGARSPLGSGRARLETVRPLAGKLLPGAFVVARSVPLGPERWALLGRAPVVDPRAELEFEALLRSLDAPPGEFWRVHGGVLARAAWAWPEWREHTLEGELVRGSLAALELRDRAAVVAALDADPELEAGERHRDPESGAAERNPDPRSLEWNWRWDPPAARRLVPTPGVRFKLCDEDADPRPPLALVDIELDHDRLWLLTPTPARLRLAERLLRDRLGESIGAVLMRDFLPPASLPRWKRVRPERLPTAAEQQRDAGQAA
jgi:hypothetical protein